jgi:hypothetical protein
VTPTNCLRKTSKTKYLAITGREQRFLKLHVSGSFETEKFKEFEKSQPRDFWNS